MPEAHRFADDGTIPNNPELPLLLYRSALGPEVTDKASAFERLFAGNGWGGSWRDGIFGFVHYHASAHEVLGIAAGRVTVRLGGEHGRTVELVAGDAVLIPAGVAHQNLGASPDLLVVGAYPPGQGPDMCRGRPEELAAARAAIAEVARPERDPVLGGAPPWPE